MYYYKKHGRILISTVKYNGFETASENDAANSDEIIYVLRNTPAEKSRRQYAVSDIQLMDEKEESPELLVKSSDSRRCYPEWLLKKIEDRKVSAVNTNYPGWESILEFKQPVKWRINIAGLGDVGGMLVTGLRLTGGDIISNIGIYDLNENKMDRWIYETSQIYSFGSKNPYPEVSKLSKDNLFDCDVFIFTVSAGVPPVGNEVQDVRMAQYKANSKIINMYGKMARDAGFKGIFAVVSDPVDLLCRSVYIASNSDNNNNIDYRGIAPDKIRGYGLGVMYARALFYSKQIPEASHFETEGRAYGPHGEYLVIADSIKNYNDGLSLLLTKKAIEANIDIRKTGFKPYIAPALSSGCLSIISTLKGDYHYSSTYMGGVFMGCLNRMLPAGIEIERNEIPQALYRRILNTYERLGAV